MTEDQAKIIARYQERWRDLNAIDALIEELQRIRKEIKENQRGLANKLVLTAKEGES